MAVKPLSWTPVNRVKVGKDITMPGNNQPMRSKKIARSAAPKGNRGGFRSLAAKSMMR